VVLQLAFEAPVVASPRQRGKEEAMAIMRWRVQGEKAESAGKWSFANLLN